MLELTTSSVALLAGLTVLTWYLIMPSFFSRPIDFTGKVSFKNHPQIQIKICRSMSSQGCEFVSTVMLREDLRV